MVQANKAFLYLRIYLHITYKSLIPMHVLDLSLVLKGMLLHTPVHVTSLALFQGHSLSACSTGKLCLFFIHLLHQ